MFKAKSIVVWGFLLVLAACTAFNLTGCASPPTWAEYVVSNDVVSNDTRQPVVSPVQPPITWIVHATSPINTDTPPPTPSLASCKVTTGLEDGTVYLRRCAMCEVVGYVTEGDELDLSPTQPSTYWYQVIGRNGAMAWIARRFCLLEVSRD